MSILYGNKLGPGVAEIPRQGLFDYEMVKMHKYALTNTAKIGILYIEIMHFG